MNNKKNIHECTDIFPNNSRDNLFGSQNLAESPWEISCLVQGRLDISTQSLKELVYHTK